MGGDGIVIQHDPGSIHQLLTVFDMTGVLGKGIHYPEFRHRKGNLGIGPAGREAIHIQRQLAPFQFIRLPVRLLQGIDPPKQCIHPGPEHGQC